MKDFNEEVLCKCGKKMYRRVRNGLFETNAFLIIGDEIYCKECAEKYRQGDNPSGKPIVEIKAPVDKSELLEQIKNDAIEIVTGARMEFLKKDIEKKYHYGMGFYIGSIAGSFVFLNNFFPECNDAIKDRQKLFNDLINKAGVIISEAMVKGIPPK